MLFMQFVFLWKFVEAIPENIQIYGRKVNPQGEFFQFRFSFSFFLSLSLVLATFDQCDQIGRFLKVLGDKFDNKSIQTTWWHFGLFLKPSIKSKMAAVIFGQLII